MDLIQKVKEMLDKAGKHNSCCYSSLVIEQWGKGKRVKCKKCKTIWLRVSNKGTAFTNSNFPIQGYPKFRVV